MTVSLPGIVGARFIVGPLKITYFVNVAGDGIRSREIGL